MLTSQNKIQEEYQRQRENIRVPCASKAEEHIAGIESKVWLVCTSSLPILHKFWLQWAESTALVGKSEFCLVNRER